MDLYEQKQPKMLVWVQEMDLYEHSKGISYSTIVLMDCAGRVKGL